MPPITSHCNFPQGKKIYIAGHRGLVGSALMRALTTAGVDPVDLIVRTHDELDLTNQQAVKNFFAEEQPDYVILAAARVGGIHANDAFAAEFIHDNLLIQANVIDAACRNGCKRLLFLGSSCIYPKLAPQPLKEEYLLTGALEASNQWYAIAKIAGVKMCQAYRKQYGFDAISAMPTNLYGPGDNYDLENSHVLPAMIRKFHLAKLAMAGDVAAIGNDELRHGLIPAETLHGLGLQRLTGNKFQIGDRPPQVILWGTGSPYRELMHVDDMADACLFLLTRPASEDSRELLVNIGTGKDLTIRDLAMLVKQIVGFNGALVWDRDRPDGTPRKLLDVSRLHALGWRTGGSLCQGIMATYDAFLTPR